LAVAGVAGMVGLAACGSAAVDSGGLTAADRNAAQTAMNALQGSNIPIQLVGLTTVAGLAPAACRIHLVASKPSMFKVYVFWIPYVRSRPYTWLDMTITKDAARDTFHLGTAEPVNHGAAQRDGSQRTAVDNHAIVVHGGDSFSKPGANCQVLMNGFLRVLPNR